MPDRENQNQDSEVSQENSPPQESENPQEDSVVEADTGQQATVAVDDLASDNADTGEQAARQNPDLPDFSGMLADAAASSIDLLNDVELDVKIELGRTELSVEEILKLAEGSVVELDKLAGDPVDILVNEQLIARGEVLVVNDNFCVRINEIVPGISETVNQ